MAQGITKKSRNKELGQAFNTKLHIVLYMYTYTRHNNAMTSTQNNCCACTSSWHCCINWKHR